MNRIKAKVLESLTTLVEKRNRVLADLKLEENKWMFGDEYQEVIEKQEKEIAFLNKIISGVISEEI